MRGFWVGSMVVVAALGAEAAEPRIAQDVPYAEPVAVRRTLDVYAPADAKNLPVVVWIHGGGWRRGDKSAIRGKPELFNSRGMVLVSINYRFVPEVTIQQQTGDVAKAIRWVHDHAKEYGGDGSSIFVMGHSAGAHLAALVCTDDKYLKAEGLTLEVLKGCVPVDVSMYDAAKQVKLLTETAPLRAKVFTDAFGDEASQKELSPTLHVAGGKHIPPFLVLCCANRPETVAQSEAFAKALRDAGVAAIVHAAVGKDHGSINSELGTADDKPTAALDEFLSGILKR
jgi:acetyl esterase/lipase